jgi:hypothetical protein
MTHSRSRYTSVAGAVLATALAVSTGVGFAATKPGAIDQPVAGSAECARLPWAERGICKPAPANRFTYAASTTMPMSAAGQAKVSDEMHRYQLAMAACGHMLLTERGICESQAGLPATIVR